MLKNLEQRFSRTRYLRGNKDTVLLRAGGSSREWLVGRELCLYALIDCTSVPAGKRHSFVEIAVRRLAPFADPECHVVWTQHAAMAWIWSRAAMTPEEDGALLRGENDLLFPESVYLGVPENEGVFLLSDSNGYEGRIWREQQLTASTWWPEIPTFEQWATFCRSAGFAVPTDVPEPAPHRLADQPWADHRRRSTLALVQRYQRPAALAAAFALAALFAWQAGGLARLAFARLSVAKETRALNDRLSNILNARERAESDAAQDMQLLDLRPATGQVQVMARVAKLLQNSQGQILEWSAPERNTIAVTLRVQNPNPEQLVKALETSGQFTEVSADTGAGQNEIVLKARTLPSTAQKAGS